MANDEYTYDFTEDERARLGTLGRSGFSDNHLSGDEVAEIREILDLPNTEAFANAIGCARQHVYNLENDGARGATAVAIASIAVSPFVRELATRQPTEDLE